MVLAAINIFLAKIYEDLNIEWYASLDEVLVHFFFQIKLNQQTCPTMLHGTANSEGSEQVADKDDAKQKSNPKWRRRR